MSDSQLQKKHSNANNALPPASKENSRRSGMAGRGRKRGPAVAPDQSIDLLGKARSPNQQKKTTPSPIVQSPPPSSPMREPRPADEILDLDWSDYRRPPPMPLLALDCVPKARLPDAPKMERRPRPRVESITSNRRNNYWDAFIAATLQAQQTHNLLVSESARFHDVTQDKELEALGFKLDHNAGNDLVAQAEKQKVPTREGPTISSLFKSGELTLTARDDAAIASVGGRADLAFDEIVDADNALRSQLKSIASSAQGLQQANALERAALLAIRHNEHKNAAESAQREIDDGLSSKLSATNLIASTMTGILHAVGGDLADTAEQIGLVATSVLSLTTGGSLSSAQARLERAHRGMKQTRDEELAKRHEAARAGARAAFERLEADRIELRAKIGARRSAHARAASRTASVALGPRSSRTKIAGIIAAIPRVEVVAARATAMANLCETPNASGFARRGLGIARYHQVPRAEVFLRVCGELNSCRLAFGLIAGDWRRRLQQLTAVKQRIEGKRPGDEE